jgi:hypothetical protein
MQDDLGHRAIEGTGLLAEHLVKIHETAKLFLAALKGFRRDLSLSVQSCPDYIESEFAGHTNTLMVPPMQSGNSFGDLGQLLIFAEDAIDGSIKLKTPSLGPNTELRDRVMEESDMVHKNLVDVSDTAHRLYQCIEAACFEFDVFNTKNIEVGHPEVNIAFDRDSLYLAMARARALGERAVRLDIDLVEAMHRIESGQKQER